MRVWEPNRDGADLTKHGVSGFGRGAEACTHDFPRCALLGHTRHRRRVFAPSDFISYASRKSLAPERACNGALSAMSDSSDLKRLVVRGYDKIDEYLVRYGSSSVRDRWLAELTTLVSEQACARVLDLGCGAGIPVARHLTALRHYVLGVDARPDRSRWPAGTRSPSTSPTTWSSHCRDPGHHPALAGSRARRVG